MTTTTAMANTIEKTPHRAWVILIVIYISSIAASMCQFKITALASWIIPMYGLTGVTLGYLMSALSLFGLILAIPTAWIVRGLGLKKSMAISIGFLALGCALSATTNSLGVLYAARVLEGVGLGLIGVTAPSCVSVWFPDKTRGIALGLQSTWVPAGLTILYNTAPRFADHIGVSGVFWGITALCVGSLVLFLLVFTVPEGSSGNVEAEGSIKDNMKLLKNKWIWLLALVFFPFNFLQLGYINVYYNTFLETMRGYSAVEAASMTSWIAIPGIFLIPLIGALFGRMKFDNRRWLVVIGFIMIIISTFLSFGNTDAMIWAFIVVLGCAGGFLGQIRAMVPMVMRGGAMSVTMGMAMFQISQNLASMSAPAYGFLIDNVSWDACGYLTIGATVIGLIAVLFIKGKAFGSAEEAEIVEEA